MDVRVLRERNGSPDVLDALCLRGSDSRAKSQHQRRGVGARAKGGSAAARRPAGRLASASRHHTAQDGAESDPIESPSSPDAGRAAARAALMGDQAAPAAADAPPPWEQPGDGATCAQQWLPGGAEAGGAQQRAGGSSAAVGAPPDAAAAAAAAAAPAGSPGDEVDDPMDEQPQAPSPADSPSSSAVPSEPTSEDEASAGRGRPRRGAAVAATARLRRGAREEQEQAAQAPRRSGRVTRRRVAAADYYAYDEDDDDEPCGIAAAQRPRRAAATAAKAAFAAALAVEAQEKQEKQEKQLLRSRSLGRHSSVGSDSYRASPGVAAADADAFEEEDYGEPEPDSSASGDDEDSASSDSDSGVQQRRRKQQQPAAARRRRGGRGQPADADYLDASDDGAAQEEDAEDGSLQQPGGLSLDAFRFDGSSDAAAAAAAAAAAKQGALLDGAAADDDAAAAAAAAEQAAILERELAEADQFADPSEFEPQQLAKVPRDSDVERVLAVRWEGGEVAGVLAKLSGKSYRAAAWLPAKVVESRRPALLRNFIARQADAPPDEAPIRPLWLQIDRVIAARRPKAPQYLVKWRGLEYGETTWEEEAEICRDGAGRAALGRFKRQVSPPANRPRVTPRPKQELLDQKLLPTFKNGRALRDYQEESLAWMINNYRGGICNGRWKPRNCILGDEMGLGKTAQSIAVMAWCKQYGKAASPFMVVAPLTTLGHWKREIETWTDLNVVLYAGNAEDRRLIRETEFHYPFDKTHRKVHGVRFDVLLASYETVLKDRMELRKLQFEALIVDEAHRLKSRTSSTRAALQDMPCSWLLLLSGTPVQNNMRELQGLMSLLDEDAYGNAAEFSEKFGDDAPSLEQIRELQAALAPVLLRRMKEDVEDLPEKEEVIIWVELTSEQRRYYKALYSQQIGALLGGVSNKNLPGMRNLAMELRKLCCHPFLCDGLEEDMALRWAAAQAAGASGSKEGQNEEVEALTRASGKMLLLHKLLPKLRAEGRQVLIFSQFKMMLDVLEDYLAACSYPFERIDGDTKHSERQAAIDRFMSAKSADSGREGSRQRSKTPAGSRGTSPGASAGAAEASRGPSPSGGAGAAEGSVAPDAPFVFLLSTRAGGQGITLTSADTVIIYDSDWNPQNDLQAMARCHRIGQERDVTVYRLVSRGTYEQQLFECASRKYGLDEAILGFAGTGDNPENDAARIEALLRLGAHALTGEGAPPGEGAGGGPTAAGEAGGAGAGAAEERGFVAEDIDQILEGRSEKRQLGSRKGNTFSVAHFGDGGGELAEPEPEPEPEPEQAEAPPKDAKAFWAELLPEAVADHEAAKAAAKQPQLLGPRRRTKVDYREQSGRGAGSEDFSGEEGDEGEASSDDDDLQAAGPGRKGLKRTASEATAGASEADGSAGKKQKSKKGGSEPDVVDPELGRVVAVWSNSHVEQVERQLLRYGADRTDKIYEAVRSGGLSRARDEVQQLCRGLGRLFETMAQLAPVVQQEEKDKRAAAAAAAAAEGGTTLRNTHGNLSVFYVNTLRDRLLSSQLPEQLPPATKKALLSLDSVRRLGRNPANLVQQLQDQHKLHLAMVKAGHATASGSRVGSAAAAPAAAAAAGAAAAAPTPVKQEQQQQPDSSPVSPSKDKRRVALRVTLRGSKGLPVTWCDADDDQLLQGSYWHGYGSSAHGKLTSIVEDILADPRLGFARKWRLDPEAAARALQQPQQPAPAPAAAPGQPPALAQQQQQPSPEAAEALAAAKKQRAQLLQEAPDVHLMPPADWKKFTSSVAARLKRVRIAFVDPDYVEPPTPSSKTAMLTTLNFKPAAPAAPKPGAAGAGAAQQRLPFAADAGKGHRLGGAPAPAAAAVATLLQQGRAVPAVVVPAPAALMSSAQVMIQSMLSKAPGQPFAGAAVQALTQALQQQQQALQRNQLLQAAQQRQQAQAVAQQRQAQAAAAAAAAAGQKRKVETVSLVDDDDSDAGPAAAKKKAKAPPPPPQPPKQQQQQQQQQDVVDLLQDTPPDAGGAVKLPHAGSGGAPAAAPAAAPRSGLVQRRVPASAELSQEHSVDEPDGNGAAATPASGGSSGKAQMQQLLGSAQPAAAANGAARAAGGAEVHPVYGGTPAAAAPAGGAKRKKAQDDVKQRKMNEFFTPKAAPKQ